LIDCKLYSDKLNDAIATLNAASRQFWYIEHGSIHRSCRLC